MFNMAGATSPSLSGSSGVGGNDTLSSSNGGFTFTMVDPFGDSGYPSFDPFAPNPMMQDGRRAMQAPAAGLDTNTAVLVGVGIVALVLLLKK